MRRALVPQIPQSVGQKILLPETEAKHLTQVLRLRNGEEIELLDGRGHFARARLGFQDRGAIAELLSAPQTRPELNSAPLTLYACIIKGDAMEWVIEKSVELGVRTLLPIESEHSVVKVEKKGAEAFQERWQKIADQALKQCGRLDRMEILPVVRLEGALQHWSNSQNHLFWADETLAASGAPGSHLAQALGQIKPQEFSYLYGPEGGFSAAERARLLELTGSKNKAITRVHLGAPILRAETAALFGVSLLVGHGKRQDSV